MADFDVDVLIVGAGPTGLMLANELTALGASLRIVDEAAVRSDKSRAVIIQSRALELLDRHGLAHELFSRGTITTGIDVHIHGKQFAALDIETYPFEDCPFPVSLLASQADTEDVLETHLLKSLASGHPGIERPVKVASVTNGEAGVTVVLEHASASNNMNVRPETVRCRYLVGCDGSHSIVRRSAGIPFDGGSYLQSFQLCDTHVENWPGRQPGRTKMFWDKGFLTLLPYAESKGIIRLMGCKPVPTSAAAEERARLQAPTMDNFTKYFAETTHLDGPESPRLVDPVWLASFRLHHRCAPTYQAGRILIAGDAAHIHSPAGGQGMNAGISDAVNLGWKLATAIRTEPTPTPTPTPSPLPRAEDERPGSNSTSGRASTLAGAGPLFSADRAIRLVASYDLERRPVGERLLRTTDHLFTLATTANPFLALCRNLLIAFLAFIIMRLESRRRKVLGAMSQLRVRYRRSPVVGTAPEWTGTVRGGDRAPDGPVVSLSDSLLGETWLLHRMWAGERGDYSCRGLTTYHLLVFAGQQAVGDAAWDAVERDIVDAAATAADIETGLDPTRAHIVAGSTGQAVRISKAAPGVPVVVDSRHFLHGRYGFGEEPGYVLVRPDGHVEHIGRLPSLAQVPAWVADRSRAVVGVEAKPWWRW